jgi:hypothetical protein
MEQELGVGARAWSLELPKLGAWSCCWSKGAMAGARAGPTWDQGKPFFFLLQRKKQKEEGDDSNVAVAFFFVTTAATTERRKQ